MPTDIEWTRGDDGTKGETWNILVGCTKVGSPGCTNCYATDVVHRAMSPQHVGLTVKRPGEPTDWTGEIRFVESVLDKPLRWKRPRRIFVNSLSDLFHADVLDVWLCDILAVMALCPQHTFQVLTKRPQIMARRMADPALPGLVARAADRIAVRLEIERMGKEQWRQIDGFPCYQVTDRGRVLLEGGSESCVWCGDPIAETATARARFCSQRCNSKAHYEESRGRWESPVTFREVRPDVGDKGHRRVTMIDADGNRLRRLVHRLVLTAFRRSPTPGEQGCHRDGDPANNALPNLRWGSQGDNWDDRRRHGNGQSHSVLTFQQVAEIRDWLSAGMTLAAVAEKFEISAVQVGNIKRGVHWPERTDWPLKNLWLGASIESDKYTFRADHLRATPAAIRFLSLEPLLSSLPSLDLTGIDWAIVGGESGPKARPMHPGWVGDIRDRCVEAGVPFFFKQWGEWSPDPDCGKDPDAMVLSNGRTVGPREEVWFPDTVGAVPMARVGKKSAGRMLDGREHSEFPEVR